MSNTEKCEACGGTGREFCGAAGTRTCLICGGSGNIDISETIVCMRCDGSGQIRVDCGDKSGTGFWRNDCPRCHGAGLIGLCCVNDAIRSARRNASVPPELHPDGDICDAHVDATSILLAAADAIDNRASQRDHENGERSMARTIASFNALTGHDLSEVDVWTLMALLKFARGQGGKPILDDYMDAAAYAALAGERAVGGRHG